MSDVEHRTAVTLTSVSDDHPSMQPKAKAPEKVERYIAILFLLGFAGFAGFGATFWINAKPWTLGATLGFGMFFIGVGMAAWGKYLMPQGPFVEERHELRGTDEEREAFSAAVVERGTGVVKRRKLLGGILGAGMGTFGVVIMFPLLRSLGPVPGKILDQTNWKKGSYIVGIDGRRVHVSDLSIGSAETVFPEGYESDPDSQAVDQVMLIRVSDHSFSTMPGRKNWTPEGYIAYSKLCTHLGCPVGLYDEQRQILLCPCHQSIFNVLNGAVPEFGPAPRPLPQLPLSTDKHGFLRASAGFNQAVGPGFWERS